MTDSPSPRFLPSVLDRLTDPDSAGTVAGLGYSLKQFKEALRRDVEDLLNTIPTLTPAAATSPELQRSILAYGLPDLTSFTGDPNRAYRLVAQQLESALARFEPRLRDVRVVPAGTGQPSDQRLSFFIAARLTTFASESFEFQAHFDAKANRMSVDLEGERPRS